MRRTPAAERTSTRSSATFFFAIPLSMCGGAGRLFGGGKARGDVKEEGKRRARRGGSGHSGMGKG